jgi:signal transduction histidine kinase
VNAEKLAVLGQLTAGISHELNNPINFIKSGLEGLKSGMNNLMRIFRMYENLNEKELYENLKAIEKEKQATRFDEMLDLISRVPDHIAIGVNRATDLVKELRSYVHKDTRKELTDINKSIDSSLILLFNEYKYNIAIRKDYGQIPKIYCYPSKLNQVFINIISNAIDAINEKVNGDKTNIEEENIIQITTQIAVKKKQSFVNIIIQDNGIGMPQEIQDNIFVPFQTSKSRGNGLGLGLFISESIIKDHNGFIEFQSEYLTGTTFSIFLPLNS